MSCWKKKWKKKRGGFDGDALNVKQSQGGVRMPNAAPELDGMLS